jgi:hypothetical protein
MVRRKANTGARSGWHSDGRPHPVGRRGPSATRSQCSSADGSGAAGLWRGAHAGEEQMHPHTALPFAGERVGGHLHDPGTARPVGLDRLRCLSGPQVPDGVAPMALLVIRFWQRPDGEAQ